MLDIDSFVYFFFIWFLAIQMYDPKSAEQNRKDHEQLASLINKQVNLPVDLHCLTWACPWIKTKVFNNILCIPFVSNIPHNICFSDNMQTLNKIYIKLTMSVHIFKSQHSISTQASRVLEC